MVMDCQSCGMPMVETNDHGGSKEENPFCKYCTDITGKLKTREEVREGMIKFQMAQNPNKTRDQIAFEVDAHMNRMPAWTTGRNEF